MGLHFVPINYIEITLVRDLFMGCMDWRNDYKDRNSFCVSMDNYCIKIDLKTFETLL